MSVVIVDVFAQCHHRVQNIHPEGTSMWLIQLKTIDPAQHIHIDKLDWEYSLLDTHLQYEIFIFD